MDELPDRPQPLPSHAVMIRPRNQIRAELHIGAPQAKTYFRMLQDQKGAIERELGYSPEWEELPESQASRISSCLNEVDPEDEADWSRQHAWLAKHLDDMHRVLAPRVSALDADAAQPAGR